MRGLILWSISTGDVVCASISSFEFYPNHEIIYIECRILDVLFVFSVTLF